MRARTRFSLLVAIVCSIAGSPLHAEEGAPATEDAQALAKKSQNPVAAIISVPFENNSYFDVGPSEEDANVLNVKPVIPVQLGDKINLINRFVAPLVYLEGQDSISVDDPEGGLGSASHR